MLSADAAGRLGKGLDGKGLQERPQREIPVLSDQGRPPGRDQAGAERSGKGQPASSGLASASARAMIRAVPRVSAGSAVSESRCFGSRRVWFINSLRLWQIFHRSHPSRVAAHGIDCLGAYRQERAAGERPGSRINFPEMEQGEQNPRSRISCGDGSGLRPNRFWSLRVAGSALVIPERSNEVACLLASLAAVRLRRTVPRRARHPRSKRGSTAAPMLRR